MRVVGVSKSGPRLHRRFIDRLNLGFPLYADRDLAIAKAFGVRYWTLGISARARRSCFLIDETGGITYRWLGNHWLDPTLDRPPIEEMYEAVRAEVDERDDDPERIEF